MMTERKLEQILARYQNSFTDKVYTEENEEHDILMDVFGISPIIKRENRQYWGRELGIAHRASGIGHRASGIGHRAYLTTLENRYRYKISYWLRRFWNTEKI